MVQDIINEIVGTSMELSVFFIVFYVLFDMKKNRLFSYIILYLSLITLVVISNHFIGGYGAFIYIFATIFSIKVYTKENFFKVLLIFVFTMIPMLIIEVALLGTVGMLIANDFIKSGVILLIANILVALLIKRFKGRFIETIERYESNFFNYVAINVFIYGFVFKLIWDYNEDIITNNYLSFGIVMVMLLVVNYFVYREVSAIIRKSKALELQEGMRETLDLMVSDIKSRQHEYKNTLTTIQGILDTSTPEEAADQIGEFLNDIYKTDGVDTELLNIDRGIVKAVLFMKANEAKDRGVLFHFSIDAAFNEAKILDFELSTLINNLLNNAFEAVEKLPDRHVEFQMGFDKEEDVFYMRTKNAGSNINPALLNRLTEKQFSTKENSQKNHGYGLWNINQIAKRNQGQLTITLEEDDIVFCATFK